jgi:hypothetical protein
MLRFGLNNTEVKHMDGLHVKRQRDILTQMIADAQQLLESDTHYLARIQAVKRVLEQMRGVLEG